MYLKIAHKIFGIAIVVLLLMATATSFSIYLTARINRELQDIANHQLPLSNTIGHINAGLLEIGLLTQRRLTDPNAARDIMPRIEILVSTVESEFTIANGLFKIEESTSIKRGRVIALDLIEA